MAIEQTWLGIHYRPVATGGQKPRSNPAVGTCYNEQGESEVLLDDATVGVTNASRFILDPIEDEGVLWRVVYQ